MARTRNRAGRRRSRQEAGSLKGWVIFLGSMAVIGFAIWQVYVQMAGRSELDARLCPVNGEVSQTAIVVDVTDPLTVAQKQDFLNKLEAVRNEIPKGGRLSLYKVAPAEERLLQPVLDLCNPGDGKDLTEATGNPTKVRERWEEQYSEPVNQAFHALTQASGSDHSPIIQSVQSVTLTQLQRQNIADKPRKLILVSDLLQNTGDLNFYGPLPSLEQLKRSRTFLAGKADLRGIDAELWMLTRPAYADRQNTALASLWMHALQYQGAETVKAYNING